MLRHPAMAPVGVCATGLNVPISSVVADRGMRSDCHLTGTIMAHQMAAHDGEAGQGGLDQVDPQCKLAEAALHRSALLGRFIDGTFDNLGANASGQHVALDHMHFFAENVARRNRAGAAFLRVGGVDTGKCYQSAAEIETIVPKNAMHQEPFA